MSSTASDAGPREGSREDEAMYVLEGTPGGMRFGFEVVGPQG